MEVLGLGEALADERRADHVALRIVDQAAVGLVREEHLGDAGDRQRIDEAERAG